jgi:hypothetical protein
MLFRPTFCANCGERIERAEWRLWTSRRFCPVCESEYKGQDLIPRVVVIFGVVAGIFGFSTYMRSGSAPELRAARHPQRFVEAPQAVNKVEAPAVRTEPAEPVSPASNTIQASPQAAAPQTYVKPAVVQAEQVYYCGAETKKGTPCSRRVKGNTRCYQHAGMPAMAANDKLRIAP